MVERCALFAKQFPNKRIKPHRLGVIYKEAGIKKKMVRFTKPEYLLNTPRRREMALVAQNSLKAAMQSGAKIVWVDEICFSRSTNTRFDWSKRHSNIEVDQKYAY